MGVNYPVPFYGNTEDNTHCFQACWKMLCKYFWPEKEFSWEELERITAKPEGKWTWQMAGLLWMADRLEVKNIEPFDFAAFNKEGKAYLFRLYGQAVADEQEIHSDLPAEIAFAKKFIDNPITSKRSPELHEIKELLTKEHIICCCVNSRALNGKEGYCGHLVIVRGFDETGFFLNDPGLPGIENRHVPFDLFERAWSYPDKNANNLMAFRKR